MTGILTHMSSFCKSLHERWMLEERLIYLKNNPNTKANGFYKRSLKSIFGTVTNLLVPRTRDSQFQSSFLPSGQSTEDLEKLVNILFRDGVSTRKIENMMLEVYGTRISHSTISKLAQVSLEEVLKWKNRPLVDSYAVLFIDAFYFPLKRNSSQMEAVYVMSAITEEGQREVIGFWIPGGSEGATNWEEIFIDLKERGLLKVDLVVADGLTGIDAAIARQYPEAKYQYCVLHATRTCLNKTRAKDSKKVAEDMKRIYLAETKDEARSNLENFKEVWGGIYPKITKFWDERFYQLTPFMNFPSQLRKYIYTTNCVERLHKEIKRRLKSMEMLQNEVSADKILFMLYREQNSRYKKTGIMNWKFHYQTYKKHKSKGNNIVHLNFVTSRV